MKNPITIKATNTTLTPPIREFIEDKISTIQKFLKSEDKVRVELEVSKKHQSGLVHRAEIDLQPRGYYADSWGPDFYTALDSAILKIKEQLAKNKDKKISLKRRGK